MHAGSAHPAIALLRLYPFVGAGVDLVQQRPWPTRRVTITQADS